MRKLSILGIMLIAAGVLLPACGHRATDDAVQSIVSSDSLPTEVKSLVKAVATDNKKDFASLVLYPLERPYPLKNIDDSAAMVAYYPTLVDDSLKSVVTMSPPESWDKFGWRGWTLDNGQYLWIDESGVYGVNYVSAAEQATLEKLRKEDMESLPGNLRGDWVPAGCYKAVDSEKVMRIDMLTEKDGQTIYRLAVYSAPATMRGEPMALFTGFEELQGSVGTRIYNFTGPSGVSATFMADMPDDSPLTMDFTSASGTETNVEVQPAYWLDLLPPKK
ncbi:MAG: hypothetical protein NC338_01335 [Firmicutes bacterium]|nr:hypothetical protein [Bacillota bacterium]MCM1401033.1 hypothetical protein [Bacteroides sp.]